MVPNSPSPIKTCSAADCGKPHLARALCASHYGKLSRAGQLPPLQHPNRQSTPHANPEQRFWAKVNKSSECWEWTGSRSRGYGYFYLGGKQVPAHRFAHEQRTGPIPEGLEIDHICHNRACVKPDHLRAATGKQNREHLLGAHKGNRSGVRGVSFDALKGRWRARVTHDGVVHFLGYFDDPTEAGEVARLKRLELFTHNEIDRKVA